MNKTFIIGNLTQDPVSRTTSGGKTVCNFSVAVNRGSSENRTTTYFRCAAWNKTGELCQQYLAKGNKVAIEGEVSVSAYKNNAGEAVGSLDLMVNNIEFLTPRSEAQQAQQRPEPTFTPVEQADDLPF